VATRTKKKRSRPVDDDEDVAPRRKKGGGDVVKLDMRKTERGKKFGHRYPEGEYKIKINSAERKQANSGNTQIILQCEIVEPEKYAGKPLVDRLTLTESAMHRVGWLFDAIGVKWSNKVLSFPLGKLEGKVLGVQLYDDDFNGKPSSKVAEYYSEEEIDDFLAEDEDDEEDEDDVDEDDEDEEDDDEDEDEEEDEYDELNLVKLKKEAKKRGIKAKKAWDEDDYREALREDDEEDDDEDEDLDELEDEDL
jgi:hypothetical protein